MLLTKPRETPSDRPQGPVGRPEAAGQSGRGGPRTAGEGRHGGRRQAEGRVRQRPQAGPYGRHLELLAGRADHAGRGGLGAGHGLRPLHRGQRPDPGAVPGGPGGGPPRPGTGPVRRVPGQVGGPDVPRLAGTGIRGTGRRPSGQASFRPAPQPAVPDPPVARRSAGPGRLLAGAGRVGGPGPRLHGPAEGGRRRYGGLGHPLPGRPLPGPERGRTEDVRAPPDPGVRGGIHPRPDHGPGGPGVRLRGTEDDRPDVRVGSLRPGRVPALGAVVGQRPAGPRSARAGTGIAGLGARCRPEPLRGRHRPLPPARRRDGGERGPDAGAGREVRVADPPGGGRLPHQAPPQAGQPLRRIGGRGRGRAGGLQVRDGGHPRAQGHPPAGSVPRGGRQPAVYHGEGQEAQRALSGAIRRVRRTLRIVSPVRATFL